MKGLLAVLALVALAFAIVSAGPSRADAGVAAKARSSRMLVTASEFRYMMSRTKVRAGLVHIQLFNRGEDDHDLRLRRNARRARTLKVARTGPEELSELKAKLGPGRYTMYCSLPGHRKLGMKSTLTVTR